MSQRKTNQLSHPGINLIELTSSTSLIPRRNEHEIQFGPATPVRTFEGCFRAFLLILLRTAGSELAPHVLNIRSVEYSYARSLPCAEHHTKTPGTGKHRALQRHIEGVSTLQGDGGRAEAGDGVLLPGDMGPARSRALSRRR